MVNRRAIIASLTGSLLSFVGMESVKAKAKKKSKKKNDKHKNAEWIVRVYDYSDAYRVPIQYAVDYYRSFLTKEGVKIEYYEMGPLSAEDCHNTQTPKIGIRVCEEVNNGGTAGSTGMDWQREGDGWALFSNQYYEVPPDIIPGGIAGRFMTCHEFGHTFGNLPHRGVNDLPYSCMSANGAWAEDTLLDSEIMTIVDLLPKD